MPVAKRLERASSPGSSGAEASALGVVSGSGLPSGGSDAAARSREITARRIIAL